MGIPNETVTKNEIAEKRRQEAEQERKEARRRRMEKSLEDTFPASDPINVTQPAATVYDKKR